MQTIPACNRTLRARKENIAGANYTHAEPAASPAEVDPAVAAKAIPSQTGVWVAVSAIAMTFAALTSALVVRQGRGADWQRFRPASNPLSEYAILMASSFTLEISRKRFDAAGVRASRESSAQRVSLRRERATGST